MSIKVWLRSLLVQVVVSRAVLHWRRAYFELRRKIGRKQHIVTVFLQIDDPYSYLLSCVLAELKDTYSIRLCVRLCEALPGDFQAAPELAAELAIEDCRRLSSELALPFLDKGPYPPTEHRIALAAAIANTAEGEDRLDEMIRVLSVFWRGDGESAARYRSSDAAQQSATQAIRDSQAELRRLGHYNSSMLHYAGEWYWGVDRLPFLTRRLEALHLRRADKSHGSIAAIEQIQQVILPIEPPKTAAKLPPLEFFFSFRSPYSYLAVQRVLALADAYGLQLLIRPVLPMIERGLPVPPMKQRYIVLDCARIARHIGVPFGRLADPQGAGVASALAAFHLAETEGKEREFVARSSRAIWAEAENLAAPGGMKAVLTSIELQAPTGGIDTAVEEGRRSAEKNQETLFETGCWGVPTLKIGDYVVWGQDRICLLTRHLETLCEDGEGILI